ncbi:MAG TPA: hypothetical protein VGI22_09630 [Xanthobacteraceae bacterium]|jgi:tetratricopeptide (TPR) repeat protein
MNKYVPPPSQPSPSARAFPIEADHDGASHGGWLRELGIIYQNAGTTLVAEGLFAQAHEKYQAGLHIFERLAAKHPQEPNWQIDLANCYALIGDMNLAQGRPQNALPPYRSSHVIWQRLAHRDPGNPAWQAQLLRSRARLASVNCERPDGN